MKRDYLNWTNLKLMNYLRMNSARNWTTMIEMNCLKKNLEKNLNLKKTRKMKSLNLIMNSMRKNSDCLMNLNWKSMNLNLIFKSSIARSPVRTPT